MTGSTPLGWVDWQDRDAAQQAAHHQAVASMPVFAVVGERGPVAAVTDPLRLTDAWSHPTVKAALGGKAFPRWHQLTGSCVGAGGGNCVLTVSALDVIRFGHPEKFVVPFWLAAYGESRRLAGMRGRGEGSLGSTFAKAGQQLGFPDARTVGLPAWTENDGLIYSEKIELDWSDGAAMPDAVRQEAMRHPVKTVAPITTADQARDAVVNGYPLTLAYGSYVGKASIQGTPPVALGTFTSRGGHQVSIQGYWDHPQLGPLFLQQNNWPASVYPTDPAGGAPCSCWMRAADVQAACTEGETYAWSQYEGYPAQPDIPQLLDWRV